MWIGVDMRAPIAAFALWMLAYTAHAQTPLDHARALMGQGQFAEAARTLETVVAAEPNNAAAWNMLGAASNYGESYRRANEAAERAVELDPENVRYYFNRALTRWEVGRFEEALADHEYVLSREPNAAHALTERGATLAALGRYDEARASWTAALAADPNYVWTHYYRGQAAMAQGRYADAAAAFATVLEREDFYAARLWLWAAQSRAGMPVSDVPTQRAWPGPIGSHLRGDISRRALERAARDARLEIDQRRLVSALYFSAQRLLAEGQARSARAILRRALALETPSFPERSAAAYELERLERQS
jgi:tetratricopeptide (TPR) repeat protein